MNYHSLVEALGDGIICVNHSMAITFINDSAKSILDLENIDTSNYTLEDVLYVQTDTTQGFIVETVQQVLKTGRPSGLRKDTYLIGKDGNYKYLSATITRFGKDSDYSAAITLRDITRLKAYEFHYINEKNKLESLFSVLPVGIIVTTIERKVVYTNPTINKLFDIENVATGDLLFGNFVKCRNCIGKLCGNTPMCNNCEIRHNMDLIELRQPFKSNIKVEMEHQNETEVIKKHYSIDFIKILENMEDKVLLVIHDITQQMLYEEGIRKAKDEAEAASKLKSQFLSNMSHEIRTPLNGIIGMLNLTRRKLKDKELIENLDIAKTSSESLLGIINDVLDYSKIEANRLMIFKKPMDLHKLIEEAYNEHKYEAELKALDYKLEIGPTDEQEVLGDKGRIKQVLTNLIDNAIKFTDNGSVTMVVDINSKSDKTVMLQVKVVDTGVGIEQNDKERIFESFIQADGSFTRRKGGTGLGLAISKEITKLMGGYIFFESVVNEGTTFTFSLVLDKVKDNKKSTELENKTIPLMYGSILLAEDDPVNQMVLSKKLEMAGHKVDSVKNGEEAVDAYLNHNYDLVILDIQMPVMSGIEAINAIVRSEKGKQAPIIALTAYALTQERKIIMDHGFDLFITKPVDLDQFETKVNHLITKTRMIKSESSYVKEQFSADEQSVKADLNLKECLRSIREFHGNDAYEDIENLSTDLKTFFENKGLSKHKSLAFKLELAARKEKKDEMKNLIEKIEALIIEGEEVNNAKDINS